MKLKITAMAIFLILLCSALLFFTFSAAANAESETMSTRQTSDTTAPTILDHSPKGTDEPINTEISITFSEPMNKSEAEEAFSITPIALGTFRWNGNSLIFKPNDPLNSETQYFIRISTKAKDINGNPIVQEYTWSFKTKQEEKDKGNGGSSWWDQWEPVVTVLTIVGTALVALVGVWGLRKKRSQLSRYIEKLDITYNKYRHDPRLCERKLLNLKDSLKKKVKQGEIEEYHYIILDKKIDDYRDEVKSKKTSGKPKIVKIMDREEEPDDEEPEEEYEPDDEEPEEEPEPAKPTKGPYKSKDEPKELSIDEGDFKPKPPKPRIIADDD